MTISDLRVRTRIPEEQVKAIVGKVVTPGDSDFTLAGPARLRGPGGQLLAVYLPGVLADTPDEVRAVLHGMREQTDQRGKASGSKARIYGRTMRGNRVMSTIAGAKDDDRREGLSGDMGCRLTRWTRKNFGKWETLWPLLRAISGHFREHAPERYRAQMAYVDRTPEAYRILDTPFSTITVNNTYATGVHKDRGDLDSGYSCLAVFRRGNFAGGELTLPEYRCRVDLRDGDLLLMDAHQWHGNTRLRLLEEGAERVSVVCYYRTRLRECPEPEAGA